MKKPSRDEKKREEVRKKKILIYGAPVNGSTGNGKLIYHMCKAFQSEGHQVFTIGLSYNGPQLWHDDIPMMPGFHCRICGEGNKGSTEQVQKIATYINTIVPDYFICVGDPYQMQQFGMGNLGFENIRTKAIMYTTIDSHGEFCNDRLLASGREEYLKICDRIISTAKFTQDEIKEWRDISTDLIYEIIDTENYKPVDEAKKLELRKKYRFKENDFVIYYAGRNMMRKRPFILLDAAVKLLCETENTYLYLNIPPFIVNNEAFYPDDINPIDFVKRVLKHKYGRDMVEEGRVIFIGREGLGSQKISEKQNAEFYQISDVLLTSTGGEGFGLTPVEANACGIPAIVPNNSTGAEILGVDDVSGKDPECGFRFGKGGLLTNCPFEIWVGYGLRQHLTTVEDTYKALNFLYKDPELRKNLGKQGREYVLKTFNKDIFRRKWLEVLKTTKKKEPKKEKKEFETIKVGEKNANESPSKGE